MPTLCVLDIPIPACLENCKLQQMQHSLHKRSLPEKAKLWIFYTNQTALVMCPLDQIGGQKKSLLTLEIFSRSSMPGIPVGCRFDRNGLGAGGSPGRLGFKGIVRARLARARNKPITWIGNQLHQQIDTGLRCQISQNYLSHRLLVPDMISAKRTGHPILFQACSHSSSSSEDFTYRTMSQSRTGVHQLTDAVTTSLLLVVVLLRMWRKTVFAATLLYPPLLRGRISACCLTSFFLNA